MKDTFGNKINLNDNVLYSTKVGYKTYYTIGTVIKLYPKNKDKIYGVDKVRISPLKCNTDSKKPTIVYACNVVVIKNLQEYIKNDIKIKIGGYEEALKAMWLNG